MKKKILSMFLAFVMCFMSFGMVFADETKDTGYTKPGDINWQGGTQGSQLPTEVGNMAANVFSAIKAAGVIIAVFLLVFFGIKYLTAGATEKAKTKEMLVPFLIGAAVLTLAPTLVEWIWSFMGAN